MSSRILRPVRAGRPAQPRSAAPLGVRLPLVAAAVVAAGLTAACGPSSQPVGSASVSAGGPSSQTLAAGTESASASASAEASPTASASPSASASTVSASPSPSRAQTASAAPKPSRTSAAPAPARIPGPGYDSSADAQKLIDAALSAAKADGRMVLLDFGANWCGNCKAADKVFAQPQTAAILGDSYHLVKVDIGGNSSANSALLRKYSPSGGTYKMPVLIVVTPSGTVRTDTHATGNPSLTSDGINSFLRKWAS
ncbi:MULTISPECIES: thioredoxin family protein [unclassified Streptomyces]|uniref:thioredoxin family protein n=1 Tax=unclassified Streptomyces TaxID=2593676 RepID=UPI00224ECB68|nr:thioredoxin family protein [Streptomyces sp. NBC_00047]MCX5609908.1 thioredoxin family protein [Streptomyces sp. NBC_00047]